MLLPWSERKVNRCPENWHTELTFKNKLEAKNRDRAPHYISGTVGVVSKLQVLQRRSSGSVTEITIYVFILFLHLLKMRLSYELLSCGWNIFIYDQRSVYKCDVDTNDLPHCEKQEISCVHSPIEHTPSTDIYIQYTSLLIYMQLLTTNHMKLNIYASWVINCHRQWMLKLEIHQHLKESLENTRVTTHSINRQLSDIESSIAHKILMLVTIFRY